jgi:hypothetical protein
MVDFDSRHANSPDETDIRQIGQRYLKLNVFNARCMPSPEPLVRSVLGDWEIILRTHLRRRTRVAMNGAELGHATGERFISALQLPITTSSNAGGGGGN